MAVRLRRDAALGRHRDGAACPRRRVRVPHATGAASRGTERPGRTARPRLMPPPDAPPDGGTLAGTIPAQPV